LFLEPITPKAHADYFETASPRRRCGRGSPGIAHGAGPDVRHLGGRAFRASRPGAEHGGARRMAAGGYTNGTPVTCAMVSQAVQDYLTAAGFPSAAVSGSQVSVVCQASTPWTDPYQAQPLDRFQVVVTIPPGTAFNSLRWTLLNRLTSISQLQVTVTWYSLNNSQVVVGTSLPD
jgi:hypothetical protein